VFLLLPIFFEFWSFFFLKVWNFGQLLSIKNSEFLN
jgi:hypothetical protein